MLLAFRASVTWESVAEAPAPAAFATVIVQRTTAPGMFFGFVVLLIGSHTIDTALVTVSAEDATR